MVTRSIKVSDLSGEPNASTIKLGAAGSWYEIDLTDAEQQELNLLLSAYLEVGRKASGPPSRRLIPKTTAAERAQIRDWATQQGFDVAPRGVIPKRAYRAYIAAHDDQAA